MRNKDISGNRGMVMRIQFSFVVATCIALLIIFLANFADCQENAARIRKRYQDGSQGESEKVDVVCYVTSPMMGMIRLKVRDFASRNFVKKTDTEYFRFEFASRFAENGTVSGKKEMAIPIAGSTVQDETGAEAKKIQFLEKVLGSMQELEYLQKLKESLIEKRSIIREQLGREGAVHIDSYYGNEDKIVETITKINKLIRFFEIQFNFSMIELKNDIERGENADGQKKISAELEGDNP